MKSLETHRPYLEKKQGRGREEKWSSRLWKTEKREEKIGMLILLLNRMEV